jgi:hypothetical protein
MAHDGRYAALLRRQQLSESLEAVGDAEAHELDDGALAAS